LLPRCAAAWLGATISRRRGQAEGTPSIGCECDTLNPRRGPWTAATRVV
jgi:hypothetical protein